MAKKKKSSKKPVKKLVAKLDSTFNCLFCNHNNSISCTLDKKLLIGSLRCKICSTKFQTKINILSQPVDVFSDWFDAVEEVNNKDNRKSYANGSDEGSSSDYESSSAEEQLQAATANGNHDDDDEDSDDDDADHVENDSDDADAQRDTKKSRRHQIIEEDDEDEDEAPVLSKRTHLQDEDSEED